MVGNTTSHGFSCLALGLALLIGSPAPALAGNATYMGIVAASADAKHVAVFSLSDGFAYDSPGSLLKYEDVERRTYPVVPLATAPCCTGFWEVLPYSKWKWNQKRPELRQLHPFADPFNDESEGKHARVVFDQDLGLAHLEILQAERWWPVVPLGGIRPKVTGTLRFPGRYLIRTHHDAELQDWDEVRAFTEDEVLRVGERWLSARAKAGTATGALRELREQGARPFTKRPARIRDADAWDYRRAKALDPVIELWAVAAAYGPLTAQDVRDLVWLLGMRNAPGHKLTALRVMATLRARDPRSADAVLIDLETDPDLSHVTPILRANYDPLRGLTGAVWKPLTEADLRPLKDDEILWIHRLLRAKAGFRFEDQATFDYFSLTSWYKPMPAKHWKKLLVDKFFLKDPDKADLYWAKDTLKAVLAIEKERGLAKPAL